MKIFNQLDVLDFLEALNLEFKKKTELVILEGKKLEIAYLPSESFLEQKSELNAQLEGAIKKALKSSKVDIEVERTNVIDNMKPFSGRFYTPKHLKNFNHIRIKMPEKHDLVLLKIAQVHEGLADFELINKKSKLDAETLLKRFQADILPSGNNKEEISTKFVDVIKALFGEEKAKDYAQKIAS